VSVVIEEMGLPNSFPVPYKWYHKAVVVDQKTVDKTAKEIWTHDGADIPRI
jgi:hypothetical protein